MTHRLTFDITLAIRSPFLFRGLEGRLVGVDVAHIRDEDRRPIIPADQIRGVMKEALLDLVTARAGGDEAKAKADIAELFGRASDTDEEHAQNEPHRGRIIFDDLVAEELQPSGETTRVEIDDETGAAKSGALQILELVAPFGQVVRFAGRVVVFDQLEKVEYWTKTLRQALALVQAIGAMKSPGFGEVVAKETTVGRTVTQAALAVSAAPARVPDAQERLRLRVTFDRPFLVDAERVAGNVAKGNHIVPGAVFKGALARRLQLAGHGADGGPYASALSALSFSSAFPEESDGGMPVGLPMPLSVVAIKDKAGSIVTGDALLVPDRFGAMIDGQPAVFQSDWKDAWLQPVKRALGRPEFVEPPTVARTHTKIGEADTAEDKALFTTLARSNRSRTWLLDIDLGRVPDADRAKARDLVATLLADGLDGIGRTGARATFARIDKPTFPGARPIHGTSDRYAIMLTTLALLLDPAELDGDGRWAMTPREAYAAYWERHLPGSRLISFFARQAWRGGYLARRRRLYAKGYFPFLVTMPGGIFQIETTNHAGLNDLLRYGLPVPDFRGAKPVTWETCPYLPENGYGRITVDHLSTAELRSLADRVKPDTADATFGEGR